MDADSKERRIQMKFPLVDSHLHRHEFLVFSDINRHKLSEHELSNRLLRFSFLAMEQVLQILVYVPLRLDGHIPEAIIQGIMDDGSFKVASRMVHPTF